nr:flagellar basal-body MS-ring/collar protein FliF [Ruminiclostridium papyrosolvens]
MVALPEFLTRLLKPLLDFWKGLDKSQKTRIFIITGIVVVSVGIGLFLITRPTYTTVISDASPEDVAAMQKILKEKGISYKLTDDKSGIIVNENDSDEAHFELATGYSKNGLTFADALSSIKINTTESDKKHIWQQLDESDIARQLKLFQNIEDADVTIVRPEKTLLIDDSNSKDAKASVVITPKDEISAKQAESIVKIVASSVEGLDPKNVTVVDNKGNVLNTDSDNGIDKTSTQYDMKKKYKNDLEKNVREVLVDQLDSFDTAKVVVNPVLDFDTLTQSSKEFTNPNGADSGAIISRQETKENLKNGDTGGTPGVNSNPGTTPSYPAGSDDSKSYNKSDVTENFQYNETNKQSEKSLGEIIPERSSAAITLLYGNRVADDSKLNDEMITQVKNLASMATGIPVENIAVSKLKIQPPVVETPSTADTLKNLLSNYGLLALLALMVIAFVIIALPKKSKQKLEPAFAVDDDTAITSSKFAYNDIRPDPVPEIDTEERSEVKKQIDKFVKQKPDAVAQLLRNWLTDDYE